uniref:Fatty acid desaturase domain-containing protein n=1 Tax=Heterosigma akashiwo TaxID=2829 RepID=A0A7S3XXY5_HETAK|mmetsp:Transcript_42144/g.61986  ORF Transcript_42144/g.61986 Transcript_42144/m.61986 type:complete len:476 (+) Transcript_42144:103-1530(+)
MVVIKSFTLVLLFTTSVSALNLGFTAQTTRQVAKLTNTKAVALPTNIAEQERPKLTDDWATKLDYDAFARDVNALGKELLEETGEQDVKHLQKLLLWKNIAAFIGVATMWTLPNPITVAALSTWTYASWTMIAHHTCHGGYNRVDAGRFHSRGFALGSVARRLRDWGDWMLPEAWNVEHNRLHHYRLGEEEDPDLVQRNLEFLRSSKMPMPLKYAVVALLAPVWKWYYYAPNTYKELQLERYRREGRPLPAGLDPAAAVTLRTLLFARGPGERAARQLVPLRQVAARVLAPFLITRFLLLPAPLLLLAPGGLGPRLFGNAVLNLLLAELLTNAHAFATIVTNHAGPDVYAFEGAVRPKSGAFYVRQVTGSVNYRGGNDALDFAHGWLNYQIEHHVWPDLSMLAYQRGAPRLRALCARHGVPYVREGVLQRVRKTVDVMVGRSSMRQLDPALEPAKDRAPAVTWRSSHGAIDDAGE